MPGYRLVNRLVRDAAAERQALVSGLRATPASIPPKYLYDALGCALYGAICELPEYYPTRTERAIFAAHRADIARSLGSGKQFVDLGAGDGSKAESWLAYIAAKRYIAVDFAAAQTEHALSRLAPEYPEVEMIGVDTKKDKVRLDAAYDDALGVTAAFNRNVLNHVNRLLGSSFVAKAWAHRAFYDAAEGRIEMHLEAIAPQTVLLEGLPRGFGAGERIHTEHSYKYAPSDFAALLERCASPSVAARTTEKRAASADASGTAADIVRLEGRPRSELMGILDGRRHRHAAFSAPLRARGPA